MYECVIFTYVKMLYDEQHMQLVDMLRNTAKDRSDHKISLLQACICNDDTIIKHHLLSKNHINMCDINTVKHGSSPLWHIVRHQNINMLQLILKVCDVNLLHDNGATVLMLACQLGNIDMVKLLLDAGANVNKMVTVNHDTAFVYACVNGNKDIIRLLLSNYNFMLTPDLCKKVFDPKHGYDIPHRGWITKTTLLGTLSSLPALSLTVPMMHDYVLYEQDYNNSLIIEYKLQPQTTIKKWRCELAVYDYKTYLLLSQVDSTQLAKVATINQMRFFNILSRLNHDTIQRIFNIRYGLTKEYIAMI